MDVILLPTNDLLNNLLEIHNFIFLECIKNISSLQKYNNIYCDIFTDNTVSFDKNDIDTTHQNYNFNEEYCDNLNINDGILKLMDNIKIFKIYIPTSKKDNYLGTFYVNIIESKNNQHSLKIVNSSDKFI